MQVSIFGKQNCARCKTTKNKLNHFINKWGLADKVSVRFFDMDTVDGMAEGAYNDVSDVPTVIIQDNGNSLARWDGKIPKSEEVRLYLQGPPDATGD